MNANILKARIVNCQKRRNKAYYAGNGYGCQLWTERQIEYERRLLTLDWGTYHEIAGIRFERIAKND